MLEANGVKWNGGWVKFGHSESTGYGGAVNMSEPYDLIRTYAPIGWAPLYVAYELYG